MMTPPLVRISLRDMEKHLDASHLLIVCVSALLLYALFHVVTFVATVGLTGSLSGYFDLATFSGYSIVAALSFAYIWAISRGWITVALAGSLFFAFLTILIATWVIADSSKDVARFAGLTMFRLFGALPNQISVWIYILASLAFVPPILGGVYLSYQLIRSGWRIFKTPHDQLKDLSSTNFSRVRIWLHILNIPSICIWLPQARQRVIAVILFSLSMAAFVLGVVLIIDLLFYGCTLWEKGMTDVYRCFQEQGNTSYCRGGRDAAFLTPIIFAAIVGIVFLVAAIFRFAGRRFSCLSLEQLMSKDTRPIILFLRSFRDDQVKLRKPRRPMLERVIAFGEPQPTLDHILLEEGTPLGPVVALGAPGGKPPFGAARKYVNHSEWQDAVTDFFDRSGRVVITLDETAGVRWELEHLATGEHLLKTLFLLPPRLAAPQEAKRFLSTICVGLPRTQPWLGIDDFMTGDRQSIIGWFMRPDHRVVMLTSLSPSYLSYLLAIRIFLHST
jgi:hypothetical protein